MIFLKYSDFNMVVVRSVVVMSITRRGWNDRLKPKPDLARTSDFRNFRKELQKLIILTLTFNFIL